MVFVAKAESRYAPVLSSRWLRQVPSYVAPSLSMAFRDLALRASVLMATRPACHDSKAWRISRYLHSVFAPVLHAVGVSQVQPISTVRSAGRMSR